eukprot:2615339-Pyramimonas_sp.AAC.1
MSRTLPPLIPPTPSPAQNEDHASTHRPHPRVPAPMLTALLTPTLPTPPLPTDPNPTDQATSTDPNSTYPSSIDYIFTLHDSTAPSAAYESNRIHRSLQLYLLTGFYGPHLDRRQLCCPTPTAPP